jgi:hypothetical protein
MALMADVQQTKPDFITGLIENAEAVLAALPAEPPASPAENALFLAIAAAMLASIPADYFWREEKPSTALVIVVWVVVGGLVLWAGTLARTMRPRLRLAAALFLLLLASAFVRIAF